MPAPAMIIKILHVAFPIMFIK